MYLHQGCKFFEKVKSESERFSKILNESEKLLSVGGRKNPKNRFGDPVLKNGEVSFLKIDILSQFLLLKKQRIHQKKTEKIILETLNLKNWRLI